MLYNSIQLGFFLLKTSNIINFQPLIQKLINGAISGTNN